MSKRIASTLATAALLASCVAAPPPPPPPVPLRRPAPVSPPALAAVPAIIPDQPFTPGRWSYTGGVARFGSPALFEARCDAASRVVVLTVTGARAASITLRASTMARTVAATLSPTGSSAMLGARDPILDALAFSRGSFTVVAGTTLLTLPARPDFARVLEDCRG